MTGHPGFDRAGLLADSKELDAIADKLEGLEV